MMNKNSNLISAKKVSAAALSLVIAFGGAAPVFGSHTISAAVISAAAEEAEKPYFTYSGSKFYYTMYKFGGEDRLELTSVEAGDRSVIVPATVEIDGAEHTVTGLYSGFGNGLQAENVQLPDTLTRIDYGVFNNATIGRLFLPKGLKSIGSNFCCGGSVSMINLDAPELGFVGENCLKGNSYIEKYPVDLVMMGNVVIAYKGEDTKLDISKLSGGTATMIGAGALSPESGSSPRFSVYDIESVDLTGVKVLCGHTFFNCDRLKEVTGTDDIEVIKERDFNMTPWYEDTEDTLKLGSILIKCYGRDGVLDLTDKKFDDVTMVMCGAFSKNSISPCTVIKINSDSTLLSKINESGIPFRGIEEVYVDGEKVECTSPEQFVPECIRCAFELFNGSPFEAEYRETKTKLLFDHLGIKYFGAGSKPENISKVLLPKDQFETVLKIHDYMVTNYSYDHTLQVRTNYSIAFCAGTEIVCEDYAGLTCYLLESAGIDAEVVNSSFTSEPAPDGTYYNGKHAWNIVKIDGEWYQLDTCWDSIPYSWEGQPPTYGWLLRSDAGTAREESSHKFWKVDKYVAVSSLIDCDETPECNIYLGDVNDDNERDDKDIEAFLNYLSGGADDDMQSTVFKKENADINFDGSIDDKDMELLLRLVHMRSEDALAELRSVDADEPTEEDTLPTDEEDEETTSEETTSQEDTEIPTDKVRGDINGDGKVTITDVSMVAAHVKGVKMLDAAAQQAADVSSDGRITVTDISMIAAHVKSIKSLD